MRILLIGPGAIGAAVAAAIASQGHDVLIAARTPFERLIVETPDDRYEPDVTVLTRPEPLDVDAVLLATKAHQSAGARGWLDTVNGNGWPLAVLQNGVDHVERISPLAPRAEIVAVVVNLPARRLGSGHIVVGGRAHLSIAPGPGGELIESLLAGSFIRAVVSTDFTTDMWRKLMLNAASGGVTTLVRTSNLVLHDPDARDLVLSVMAEVAAVGRAEGADLPVGIERTIVDGLLANASGHVASIVADRLAGLPTEWQVRNQIVVKRAEQHGIDVPLNRLITTLIRLGEPPVAPPASRI